ncbi:flagellar basal body protein FliL [Alicyclobacillaceae bacterium I2511]|nr:flagellar basal body protein FliL [Alicyclobacillaceae bacterium I2511]
MWTLIGTATVAIAVAAGGTYYWKFQKASAHEPIRLTAAQMKNLRIDLPETTANLQDGLVQFTLSLEASDSRTKQELSDLTPVVEDAVNRALLQFTTAQLHSEAGVESLKQHIMTDVNALLPNGRVTGVYFATIVVQ